MKLPRLLAAAFAATLIVSPALAQLWPPPPPPFVTNPRLTPPPGTPSPLAPRAAKQTAKQQARAERRAAHAERKMNRHARANACHRQADAEGLAGRERRRFVRQCRHGR